MKSSPSIASRLAVLACVVLPLFNASIRRADSREIDFNRDVRPILAENCFQCHGPDPRKREADLRLDTQEGSRHDLGGYRAVVPEDPDQSHLLIRVTASDEQRMPPIDTGKRLTPAQVSILRDWIVQGGTYAEHWAFLPMQRGELPAVQTPAWPRNPIDRFVLRRLESHQIAPSPPAPAATRIRRVFLDLLGVPPTVAEVDAFVSDSRPGAYERMVDRVLARPEFGERWGRHWLDQARYADSHGYTNDNERIMWPYRDWVIQAVNRDLPFDQFTIEQLAGDLLPESTLQQRVATGFHRNTLINTEGGTKPDQFKDEQVKDRVDTTGTVWMGLTVGCAKCHSHKYDPISQREYYELYAFFNSTADRNSETPKVKVPTFEQAERLSEIDRQLGEIRHQLLNDDSLASRQVDWETRIRENDPELQLTTPPEYEWTVPEPLAKSLAEAELKVLDDQSILVSGIDKASDEYQVTLRSPLTEIRSVRVELLPDESLPNGGPGRSPDGTIRLSEFWFRTGDGRELRFSSAVSQNQREDRPVDLAIDNSTTTAWVTTTADPAAATAWFVLPDVLKVEEGHALTFFLQFETGDENAKNLGRFRLAIAGRRWRDVPSKDELKRLAAIPRNRRASHHRDRLRNAFLSWEPTTRELIAKRDRLQAERALIDSRVAEAMVMQELDERPVAHLQVRGDFLRPGAEVAAGGPRILPSLPEKEGPHTRLDLARWLVREEHPLTARVTVNRFWMRLFGRGLVETENDFGIQGTLPTHPQLLDWLALELPYHDWSVKRTLRTIVCSATYQQSSAARPDLADLDRGNHLLARQSRIRVEAEVVRDIALTVSGLMQHIIGGPSVYPPQPEGVYAFTQRAKDWQTSVGADRYRRGVYTFLYRSAPYPMMTTFDAPGFNTTCTRRARSNTPLQSLTLANSAATVEFATAFADRITREGGADDLQRLSFAFRTAVGRQANEQERTVLLTFLQAQRERYRKHTTLLPPGVSPDDAAWVATARVLLNLDETITRE